MRYGHLVEYQCGVCHKVQTQFRDEKFYQCVVCATFLCPDCDCDGVCPSHYEVLKPADQNILARFAEKEDTLRNRLSFLQILVFFFAALALVFLISVIGLIYMEGFASLKFTTPFLVLGVIFAALLITILYYQSRLRAQQVTIKITIEGILLKYPELETIIMGREEKEEDEEEEIPDGEEQQ